MVGLDADAMFRAEQNARSVAARSCPLDKTPTLTRVSGVSGCSGGSVLLLGLSDRAEKTVGSANGAHADLLLRVLCQRALAQRYGCVFRLT